MTDEQTDGNQAEEPPGWVVLDPDGNVVDSGPVTQAMAAFLAGEFEGEQQ